MGQLSKKKETAASEIQTDGKFDLDALLHPARGFAHPMDVARDPDLTLNEKRAILASWASDACAVEAAPELRLRPRVISCVGMISWMPSAPSIARPTATANHCRTISAC
jgi:hypothetical protein